jgi:arabinogalactan oligomer/maltooligosaccharide transport system substrate-binding protein
MDRRSVLRKVGVAGAFGALAGCMGVQEQSSDGSGGSGGNGSGGNGSGGANASADGGGSAGPTGKALAWYALPETETEKRKQLIEQFNSNSDHTVEGADISDLKKKTTSAIPAGQGPATFDWAHDWVGDYSQRGFIVGQGEELDLSYDQFTDAAAEAVEFDGKTYGVPYGAETVALVYNEELVDEAPTTVSEMVSTMKEVHDPGSGTYGMGYPFDPYFTSAWAQAMGGYVLDPEKDPMLGIAESETVEGLEFALENFKPYMPKDPSYEPQAAAFADGNAAFAINGPWYLSTLNEKGVDFGVAKLPGLDGGSPTPFTGIQMWYFSKAMQEDEATAAAARAFTSWHATNEEWLLERAKEQGQIPVLDSLAGSDDLPAEVQAFSEAVQQGIPMPTHPKMNKVWGPYGDALKKAFNGDADVAPAMEQAASSIRSNWE